MPLALYPAAQLATEERRRALLAWLLFLAVGSDINYLIDVFVMHKLEVNVYGTKKDILVTLFMGKQLKHEFNFKDLCAFKPKFAITKNSLYFELSTILMLTFVDIADDASVKTGLSCSASMRSHLSL